MSSVATPALLTADDYLEWEERQVEKHEYHHGEIFQMSGASPVHALITANLIIALGSALRAARCPCRVYSADLRVSVEAGGRYVYPDVTVVCGAEDVERRSMRNPVVVVEVLSPSTEAYDRGAKLAHYRTMPALREIVLVAQTERRIDVHRRDEGGSWSAVTVRSGALELAALGVALDLGDVYDGVGAR